MAHTVLVTGANGFIGSHTTLLMESLGHKVIPVDAVPRSTDLSLLGITTSSHIMDVTDDPLSESFATRKSRRISFTPLTRPETKIPSVLDFCYHAMTNILEAAKALKIRRILFKLRFDLRPTEKARSQSGQRRRRGHDLSHLFLPCRENRFGMDG